MFHKPQPIIWRSAIAPHTVESLFTKSSGSIGHKRRPEVIPDFFYGNKMALSPWRIIWHERLSRLFGLLAIIVSGFALIGWFVESVTLKGVGAGYIPMAPNTALLFVLLGSVLASFNAKSAKFYLVARIATTFAAAVALTRLTEYAIGLELRVDHWLFRFPAESVGLSPVGKMAFPTAITFMLISAAFLLVTLPNHRWANDLARVLAIFTGSVGLAFSLGYLYGAPLLYGGRSIPMALNTAFCFTMLAVGLVVRASTRDIAERRWAKEALQRAHDELENRVKERTTELVAQQQFLHAVVDTSPSAIFVKDSQGRFTMVNRAAEQAYGRPVEEIIGKMEAELNGDPREIDTFRHDDAEVIQTLKPRFVAEEQLTNPRTGETRTFEAIKVPLRLPGKNEVHILGVATDITDRKRTEEALRQSEEQLRQSQKLEGIGQLAGGIAHDFNNLLTVIGGYSDLLLRHDGLDEKAREKLEEVHKAADRAASLTRQLLAFSRKQVLQPEILDLNSLVDELGKMLRRLINEDIEIRMSLESDVARINADPGQVEQVLINLVVNARDAMPQGGQITIATANVELDQGYSDLHISVTPGEYVMLAVSDTGIGMDAETRKRIFEPFFTTKEVGKGTGLGLSTIYGIVKQSGGNIWVYSEPGKGTTFKIYFPRVAADTTVEPVGTAPQKDLRPATETILLVEDEENVRKLAASVLEASGYKTLVATSGEEAIEICKTHVGEIDLLLTDVVMPRMNGKRVADKVRSIRPYLQVLYMSGYTDHAIVHHGVLDAGTNYIEKPFTARSLNAKVRAALDKAPEDSDATGTAVLRR